MLGIESLSARDEAWRRLSLPPPQNERTIALDLEPGATSSATSSPARPRAMTMRGPAVAPDPNAPVSPDTVRRRTGAHVVPPALRSGANVAAPAPGMTASYAIPQPPPPFGVTVTGANLQAAPAAPAGNKWLFLALALIGALAVVAITVALLRPPQAAPSMPPIRVVAEPTPPQPPPVVAPSTEESAPQRSTVTEAEPSTRKPRRGGGSQGGPDPAGLTKAFRKQQGKIEQCFKEHTAAVQGMPRMQLEFELDAAGKVLNVGVDPSALAGTPLGQCLRNVGKTTRFPGQGQPVSFAIPITASRSVGG